MAGRDPGPDGGRDGLLDPRGRPDRAAALEPLARPADANDARHGDQRTADALTELCRRSLEGVAAQGRWVRPQLLVTIDLASLLEHPDGVGGDTGWAGPLDAEACRPLACDGTVTRVLVNRQPAGDQPPASGQPHPSHQALTDHDPATDHGRSGHTGAPDHNHDRGRDLDSDVPEGLQGRLRAAMTLLPPTLGGAPSQPWTSAGRPGS